MEDRSLSLLGTPLGRTGTVTEMGLRTLALPGLALLYQEGSTVVAWTEQQLLCLLPTDALVQPPVQTVGTGWQSLSWLPGTPSIPESILPQLGHVMGTLQHAMPSPQVGHPGAVARIYGQVLWWSHVPWGPPLNRFFLAFTRA